MSPTAQDAAAQPADRRHPTAMVALGGFWRIRRRDARARFRCVPSKVTRAHAQRKRSLDADLDRTRSAVQRAGMEMGRPKAGH